MKTTGSIWTNLRMRICIRIWLYLHNCWQFHSSPPMCCASIYWPNQVWMEIDFMLFKKLWFVKTLCGQRPSYVWRSLPSFFTFCHPKLPLGLACSYLSAWPGNVLLILFRTPNSKLCFGYNSLWAGVLAGVMRCLVSCVFCFVPWVSSNTTQVHIILFCDCKEYGRFLNIFLGIK